MPRNCPRCGRPGHKRTSCRATTRADGSEIWDPKPAHPVTSKEDIIELAESQGWKCGGCETPLSHVAGNPLDEMSWVYPETEGRRWVSRIEARMGIILQVIPRRLGGSHSKGNLHVLCTQCQGMGSTTKNLRMPNWLLNKSEHYLEENPDFRGITHLMRTALENYISTEEEKRKRDREYMRMKHRELIALRAMESITTDLKVLIDDVVSDR